MRISFIRVLATLFFCAALSAAPAPSEEFRAVWVTRFEWPRPDAGACRAAIDEIMKTLAANRFNAVMFQIRGQCDTLYPSPEEPWSQFISPSGNDPGFDPLVYAIEAAHANRLEFHAYINTHVAWLSAKHELPAAASHVFYRHFNATDTNTCNWLAHGADGKPVQWGEDDYVWIAPGVPAAQAYTRRQIMHVVKNYDIDGVHLDRIRTGGPEFSHDPISMARLSSEQANPRHLGFDEWTSDQILRFCCNLYAQIAEAKPRVKISSAPLGLTRQDRYPEYPPEFHYAVAKGHQDAQAWLAAGAMDFLVPQIYWSDSDNKQPDFSRVLPEWIDHAADRHVYVGMRAGFSAVDLAHQIQTTRGAGGRGNVAFSYNDLNRGKKFAALGRRGRGVYASSAAAPAMPWKDNPTEGIILGTVADARTAQPVVDAQIRRTSSDEVTLASADGIYSFLKVPPGRYDLNVVKPGWSELRIEDVDIAAGKVVRVDVALNELPPTSQAAANIGSAAQPSLTTSASAAIHPATQRPKVTVVSTEVIVERSVLTSTMRWILGILGVIGLALGTIAVWVIIERLGKDESDKGSKSRRR